MSNKIDISKFPKTWSDVMELVEIIENLPSESLKCDFNSVYDVFGEFHEFRLDDRANVYFQYYNYGVFIEVKNGYFKDHIYHRFEVGMHRDDRLTTLEKAIGAILSFISWYNKI